MPTKILLDTDIGSDIDDAFCLAYLLANPACDLLGITTVTGDTVQRASMASVLCKIAGKSIPIHPGCREPLLIPQIQTGVPQASALVRWDHDTTFSQGEAIEFLRHTIRSNPGEIVLLGIGPLTNIATLFKVDEEIPSLLKGLVLMCGTFLNPAQEPEWNAKLDPAASAIVYRATPACHRSIGLDVTLQVRMPAPEAREKLNAPLLRPVLDFAEVWFQNAEHIVFHDPLAAATIFDDTICRFDSGLVDIDLNTGATNWHPADPAGHHQIAATVDPAHFLDHYFSFFK